MSFFIFLYSAVKFKRHDVFIIWKVKVQVFHKSFLKILFLLLLFQLNFIDFRTVCGKKKSAY